MKRFTEYLNEDFDPAIFNADGSISITDPTVMDAINSNLEVSTSCSFRTPYNALEEIRKMLAYYKIFLPKSMFLDQNHGNDVFEVSQFGEKMGMNNQGEVVTASDSPLFVYFEWSLNEKGMYEVFAALVNQEELDEILADYDAEVADDETELQEQRSMGKVSKMLYKVVNQAKSQKQSDDVDAYIEHEKQGKTFTQVNEASSEKLSKYLDKVNKLNRKELKARGQSPSIAADKVMKKYGSKTKNVKVAATEEMMPNLKKKMGAKKVTLSNMMRKEETVNEIADTPRGKEAVRMAVHRADATAVDAAINPPRSKKGKREAKNAMKTIDRGIAVHKKQGGVLDPYLKRSYGIKEEVEQIDEVSKKTLASYIKKASHDVATKSALVRGHANKSEEERQKMNFTGARKHDEFSSKMFNKSWNRRKGIAKAADKLATEEKAPFDNPTETPSTPYKNPASKSKQLARAAMKEIMKGKEEKKRLRKSLREK